ncbi:MAG: helix-turn-helix transcriptional regulator [Fimbriimonadaceae bacterium]|nr:helix-turn-helix transcriptional regulator [Fimbriimonadaceae bacterium]QYK57513.1 MAG: helix-turn-helix transcriptional regulator [Fimbriimonadaceae bacterium]
MALLRGVETDFGALLAQARQEKGLSVLDLAEQSNLPRNTIDRWEKGHALPTMQNFDAVADALGLLTCERRRLLATVQKPRTERHLSGASNVRLSDGSVIQAFPSASELLKGLRQSRELSLSEVAKFVGASKSAVSHWESGRCWPCSKRLEALIAFLGADEQEANALRARQVAPTHLCCPSHVDDVWVWFRDQGLWSGTAWGELEALKLRAGLATKMGLGAQGRRWLVGAKILHASTKMISGDFGLAKELSQQCLQLAATLPERGAEYWRSLCLACLATVVYDEIEGVKWVLRVFEKLKDLPKDGMYGPTLLAIKAFALAWERPLDEAESVLDLAKSLATDSEAKFYVEFGRVRLYWLKGELEQALAHAEATVPDFVMDRAMRKWTLEFLRAQIEKRALPPQPRSRLNHLPWRLGWLAVCARNERPVPAGRWP